MSNDAQGAQPHGQGHVSARSPALRPATSADHSAEIALAIEHATAIIQSSDDAIISKTLDGMIVSWNRGAQTIFGYRAEEMIGRTMLILFPPDRLDEERFILDKIVAGERVEHFETIRIRKDGRPITVSVTISPIYNGHGQIIGASKVARDITHRLQLDAQLQSLSEHIRAIVQSSDDAIISKTLDGVITSWNSGAEAIFGYSESEMLGGTMLRLFPPDRMEEERAILEQILAGKKVDHFESVRICKDGRRIDVSVTISPIRDNHGQVIGASKIARDITRQKAVAERLRLTANVFTHASEAIVITDSLGNISEINSAFTRITGYDRSEVIGQTSRMFHSSRQGPEVFADMWADLLAHGHCQGEVWSRRKNGEPYAALLTVSSVLNADGGVLNYVALFADVTQSRHQQERLERLAHFDTLTELPNRLLLSDRLNQAILSSKRSQEALAVVYLDLDGFKDINDRFGHDVGDAMLIAISCNMQAVLRDIDTLARIGGDEFVAILVDIKSEEECERVVERILSACSEPVTIDGQIFELSASIGVTIYPWDDADPEQLLRHADRAMYEAKQSGKDRYHMFDSVQDIKARSRLEELVRISQALEQREFVLHYQPKVNLRTGHITGAEALIRWQHPTRGLLAPGVFLPSIEGHPISDKVGAWVIDEALRQMTEWQTLGIHMPVSINIGARQLQQEQFVAQLAKFLAVYPAVDPSLLELEILETSALENIDAVSSIMRACQELGVHFSVDDFGTGYSSLTYLKRLPAGTLKIDQSFVRDMLIDHEDLAIVRGIIGLAAAFRRKVIAEGVETAEQCRKLLDLGCELAQGFYFARPIEAARVPEWASNWPSHWERIAPH